MQYEADKQCPSTLTLNPLAGGGALHPVKGLALSKEKLFYSKQSSLIMYYSSLHKALIPSPKLEPQKFKFTPHNFCTNEAEPDAA